MVHLLSPLGMIGGESANLLLLDPKEGTGDGWKHALYILDAPSLPLRLRPRLETFFVFYFIS